MWNSHMRVSCHDQILIAMCIMPSSFQLVPWQDTTRYGRETASCFSLRLFSRQREWKKSWMFFAFSEVWEQYQALSYWSARVFRPVWLVWNKALLLFTYCNGGLLYTIHCLQLRRDAKDSVPQGRGNQAYAYIFFVKVQTYILSRSVYIVS